MSERSKKAKQDFLIGALMLFYLFIMVLIGYRMFFWPIVMILAFLGFGAGSYSLWRNVPLSRRDTKLMILAFFCEIAFSYFPHFITL
jgi:hypothetical protein